MPDEPRKARGVIVGGEPYEIKITIVGPPARRSIFHYEFVPDGPGLDPPQELGPGESTYSGNTPTSGVLHIDLGVASGATADLCVSQGDTERAAASGLTGNVKWDLTVI